MKQAKNTKNNVVKYDKQFKGIKVEKILKRDPYGILIDTGRVQIKDHTLVDPKNGKPKFLRRNELMGV